MRKQTVISIVSLVVIIALLVITRIAGGNSRNAGTGFLTESPSQVPSEQDSPASPAQQTAPTATPLPTDTPTPTLSPTPTATPTPTEPPVPTIAPEYLEEAQAVLDRMTIDEKIYQLFLVTPEQLTGVWPVTNAYDKTKNAIRNKPVAGIVYASQNIDNKNQLTKLLSNSQSYSKFGLFLSIQEETGALTGVAGTNRIESFYEIGSSGNPDKAYESAASLGRDLLLLGFNLNLAPNTDITVGISSFGSDAATVASMTEAYVKGGLSVGMPSVLCHFPLPNAIRDERTLKELQDSEWKAFSAGIRAGASVVMVGYADMASLSDTGHPACLNPDIVLLLREELDFNGVIMTDALDSSVITSHYNDGEAALMAIQAGADIIYRPADLDLAVNALKFALAKGSLSEERINESVLRILALKAQFGILKQ